MKRVIILLWLAMATVAMSAQTIREEIEQDPARSGGSFYAYPGPTKQLTPAPKGKKPFYISHYGRHGSRNLTKRVEYEYLLNALTMAKEAGTLTMLGEDVLHRVKLMDVDAAERMGELTNVGARQQQDIARRMMERFPEVFEGRVSIEAKSTTTIRSILSMTNGLVTMKGLNPQLQITQQASLRDMHHLFHIDKEMMALVSSDFNRQLYADYCNRYPTWERVVNQLFTDTCHHLRNATGEQLGYYLFRLASDAQNSDVHNQVSFYDLFTTDELYQNWKKENAYWYMTFSYCPSSGGQMPYTQRFLLDDIVNKADSCLLLKNPGATLRFGHDTALLPLICLLGINGYNLIVNDPDQLEEHGWIDYQSIPMAANLQFIFYRKNMADDDVLVKVLLNENEATLPIPTDIAPYYHWCDFRNFCLRRSGHSPDKP